MASHRMPDSDRPRRAVPAWVTASFVDETAGQEAPPASAPSAPVVEVSGSTAAPVAKSAPVPAETEPAPPATDTSRPTLDPNAVVPDYPPSEDLLPPAPTSPALHTAPLTSAAPRTPPAAGHVDAGPLPTPAPVSPVDAVREPVLAGPAHQGPVVPRTGQPRFSVPGLEHVLVEGSEPEPSGPVGYRTPARFAHQQAATAVAAPTPATRPAAPMRASAPQPAAVHAPEVTAPAVDEPGLQADAAPARARRTIGATPAAVLGAVTGIATLGLAAWWFTAPSTVHAVGLLLGVVAIVCSSLALRNPAASWQRPVALLGLVLGVVGTLALAWAVATAVLPAAGVTLPDVTGTGTVPTLAP